MEPELPPEAQAIVNAALSMDYGHATPAFKARLSRALRAVIQECAVLGGVYPDTSEKKVVIQVEDIFKIIHQLENHNG